MKTETSILSGVDEMSVQKGGGRPPVLPKSEYSTLWNYVQIQNWRSSVSVYSISAQ